MTRRGLTLRYAWPWRWADDLVHDVRYALRSLRRLPRLTVTATLVLALGIGVTTAMVTLVQQVMLRPLPVPHPENLWRVGDAVQCCYRTGYGQNDWSFFSGDAYRHFRDTAAFEELAAFQVGNTELGVRRYGSPAAVTTAHGEFVSGNFFKTFGIPAWRGRLMTDADDREGAPPVAVMSFHAWQATYGSDPSVVGATYDINGHPFTMIGIAPPSFYGARLNAGSMADVWLPLASEPLMQGETSRLNDPRTAWLDIIGRVRPATNPRTLEARLQIALHEWLASHLAETSAEERARSRQQTLHLTPGGDGVSLIRENYKNDLQLLSFAAGCVLLMACANVANLLLARGLRHRHQTALRAALGASRARLVRQALAESVTIAIFGAAAGVVVAYVTTSLILRAAFTSPSAWVPVSAAPSLPVLLFAVALSVITGIAFGMAPASLAVRVDPIDGLRGANRSTGGHRHWTQNTLVIVQASGSLVLLSAAALLGQSVRNLQHQDFGFDVANRYLVSIDSKLAGRTPEQLTPRLREMEDRLRAIPGVRMASLALYGPMSGSYWSHAVTIDGAPERLSADDAVTAWTRVTPGFFETLGNRIVAGRSITVDDDATTRRVAVINEAFARKFFGNKNPIGSHFGPQPAHATLYEVVGVVSDVRYFSEMWDSVRPMYFVPQAQSTHFDQANLEAREVWSHYPYNVIIWAPGKPPQLEAQISKVMADVDVPMYQIHQYTAVVHDAFAQQTMIATLTSLFAGFGLVLAAAGLYGVTAYSVEQRTSEMGVRIALGADRRSLIGMVLREAGRPVALGLVLGIPVAIGVGLLLARELFGVSPWDPLTTCGASLVLGMAALVAAAIPAVRAANADPVEALRAQ